MFEKMGNPKEDELFVASGGIEIDMIINKEKRKKDRQKRSLRIKGMLKEKGLRDPEFIREFKAWYGKEQEIVEEVEDRREYGEEQIALLFSAAEIFAEIGLKYGDLEMAKEALERLEGTEDAGYMDGALFDAIQKMEAGVADEKAIEGIESKISELKRMLKRG